MKIDTEKDLDLLLNDSAKLEGTPVAKFDPETIQKVKDLFEENYIPQPTFSMWNESVFRAYLDRTGESKEYIDDLCEQINSGTYPHIKFIKPVPLEPEAKGNK